MKTHIDINRTPIPQRVGERMPRHCGLCTTLFVFTTAAWGVAPAIGQSTNTASLENEDAMIFLWEQDWTVDRDGSVTRRDRRWVKLLSPRAFRRLSDPRIDYLEGEDTVTIHMAQTVLPDGEILPVPEYSLNIAAPADISGWPAYAAWRQQIISFSGVQVGATLALDYEVKSKPSGHPWLSADLRLDADYPIIQRVIRVTLPSDMHLDADVTPGKGKPAITESQEALGDSTVHIWKIGPVPGARAESGSLPWQERCPRLCWTTAVGAKNWTMTLLAKVDEAGRPDEPMVTFAKATIEDETKPAEQLRKIVDKLKARFHYFGADRSMRALKCRPATEVYRSNYGNPLEAGALCLALARCLDIPVQVSLAVEDDAWNSRAATDSMIDGIVLILGNEDERQFFHARDGMIADGDDGPDRRLLFVRPPDKLVSVAIPSRREGEAGNRLEVSGELRIGDDGTAQADLELTITGAFFAPESIDTSDKQGAYLGRVATQLLGEVRLTDHSIKTLSEDVLQATASFAREDALPRVGGQLAYKLGDGPACLELMELPLENPVRHTALRIAWPFLETLDLTVKIPQGWSLTVTPAAVSPLNESWGEAAQEIEVSPESVRVRRRIAIHSESVSAESTPSLRNVMNALRRDSSRCILLAE